MTVKLGCFQDLLLIAAAWSPHWFAGTGVQNNCHDQRVGDDRFCLDTCHHPVISSCSILTSEFDNERADVMGFSLSRLRKVDFVFNLISYKLYVVEQF